MDNFSISSNTFGNNVRIHQGDIINYASESPQSKSDACRNALFLADPIVDRDTLKRIKGRRTAGTCEWIRNDETYQSWLDGDVQCLWITGGPGKGKTMLSIFLTEELEKRTQESKTIELLIFFFCTPDEKHSSAVAILRGLAYQLIRKRPDLVSYIISDFESAGKTQETLHSPNALWMVLEKLLEAPDLGTVFCVLDGLDECDEESSSLLVDKFYEYFLESSEPSNVQFKLAVVSRKIDLLDAFPQVKLDPDNDNYVNDDIQAFIRNSVQRLERIRGFNNIRESIQTTLLDRAQGTFLWVGFVMAELSRKRTCTQIMETLEGIPRGLHGVYSRMLSQIESSRRSVVLDILQWVTLAVRPLTVSELSEAIHLPPTAKISKEQAVLDYITLCGHILIIHDQQVSLVHQSARDYLLQSETDSDPTLKEFHIQVEHAHATVAEVCLDCIEKSDLRNTALDIKNPSVLQKSPLLQYAAMHWPEHASCCSDANDKNPLRLSRPFLQETSSMRNHWWQTYNKETSTQIFLNAFHLPLLHMTSYFGIYVLARELLMTNTLLRTPPAVNETLNGWFETTPLHLAVRRGHTAVVQLLLANGAGGGYKALRHAASKGNTVIVELLLADGTDGKDEALRQAAYGGHMATIQLLLAKGAGGKDEALRQATYGGHMAAIQLLLANGAGGKDEALVEATFTGRMDIVELLLANGAGVKDEALVEATSTGRMDIVQLLLANGAGGKDKALRQAARKGHMAIVKLLLANGAGGKNKALHSARLRGFTEIVQLLMNRNQE
ncbi:uncharacterized protein Triagg1_6730 [Trichoderma aggressivum f. europaeum]|uniref:NACHT domain-containing protein n=1 Tax=Trichoderma aggressivum f. europaeum TaxID=173218 RepID=A0AAE1ICR3_9HYPO|nr:hypothetical protein Triagg1_6730 [Trichoderma aggressivum f. europaeum]